jgi:hypothetical protein
MRNLTSQSSTGLRVRGSLASPLAAPAGEARRNPARGYGAWLAVGLLVVAPGALVAPGAWAQQAPSPANPAHDAPSPADLEPGVNTSVTPPPDTAAPAPAAPEAKTKPTASSKPAAVPSKADTPVADVKPKGDTHVATAATPKGAAPTGGKGGKSEDHLQLDTTQITGNQELPKVLYIVPWKRSDLGDLLGKPANSLIDEVLQPVDRDVFKRENRYYDAVKPDANGHAGDATGQTSAEKR